MYYGIKYEGKSKGKSKNINESLNKYGCAREFHGKTRYCFKNPFVALRVAKTLNSVKLSFKYTLCKLEKEEIENKVYIKTYTDFENYINKQNNVNTL